MKVFSLLKKKEREKTQEEKNPPEFPKAATIIIPGFGEWLLCALPSL